MILLYLVVPVLFYSELKCVEMQKMNVQYINTKESRMVFKSPM